mmetsp:Transcript_24617/g.41127  ORF Transcript_24617/g.41127 Transcript_24617/m.41127 type:complete len:578 (+) Transcript_24617:1095-2828(+)
MCLLDLVEEHHGVGTATHGLGQLTALVVAHVTGRGADELGDSVPLHELRHIQAHHRVLGAEIVGRERLAQLGLADAGRAGEDEGSDGPVGVLQANARATDRTGDRDDCLLLSDDARVEGLLHLQQLHGLVGGNLLDGDSGPAGHNLRDVRFRHDGAHAALELRLVNLLLARRDSRDLRFQLHLAIAELASLLEVLPTDGAILLLKKRLKLLVQVARLLRERSVPEAHAGAGLVHKIDRLIGEEAVRNELVCELGSLLQSLIGVGELVVGFVTLAKSLKDADAVIHGGLRHHHGLEAALEGGVLLNVLAVLIQSGCANALQLSTGKRGLQDVGGIDSALGGTSTDKRVHLVDHEDDVIRLLDFLHKLLQTLFELTTVFGARDQEPQVQGDHLLTLKSLGHITGLDQLCKALRDGGLAHTGLTNQARVVLGTTAQNLGHAFDLLGASNHGVELALLRLLGEISAILFKGGGLVATRCARRTAHAGTNGLRRLAHHTDHLGANLGGISAEVLQDARSDTLTLAEQAEQQMLGTDVVVPQLASLLQRELQHALGAGCEGDLHSHEPGPTADDLLHLNARLL